MDGGWCAPPPECPGRGGGHSLQDPTSVAHPQVALQDLRPSHIDEVHRLKTKKAALQDTLADTATKPQRKATVPSKEVVWALEEGASGLMSAGAAGPDGQAAPGRERYTMMDAYIMSLARFQLGCSARFNDLQHVHPKDLRVTTHTLELQAWQTKTVSAAKIRKQPVPLICPKFSFTGKDWWLGMVTVIRKMTKLDQFKDMDFLIPTVNKDFNGLIARPSTPDRALRWLKDALVRQGVTRAVVDPLTWHSFRVFIPDCAFQLGIPRTQRQYLGNWLHQGEKKCGGVHLGQGGQILTTQTGKTRWNK